jgi:hypothetical protein
MKDGNATALYSVAYLCFILFKSFWYDCELRAWRPLIARKGYAPWSLEVDLRQWGYTTAAMLTTFVWGS